jgi:hypothetical protein
MTRFDSVIKCYSAGTLAHGAGRTGRHAAANNCPPGAGEHAPPW